MHELVLLIENENRRQLKKWGAQDHALCEWLAIVAEEFGELAKAVVEKQFGKGLSASIVSEAIETATLCLKIAEMNLEICPMGGIHNWVSFNIGGCDPEFVTKCLKCKKRRQDGNA